MKSHIFIILFCSVTLLGSSNRTFVNNVQLSGSVYVIGTNQVVADSQIIFRNMEYGYEIGSGTDGNGNFNVYLPNKGMWKILPYANCCGYLDPANILEMEVNGDLTNLKFTVSNVPCDDWPCIPYY